MGRDYGENHRARGGSERDQLPRIWGRVRGRTGRKGLADEKGRKGGPALLEMDCTCDAVDRPAVAPEYGESFWGMEQVERG